MDKSPQQMRCTLGLLERFDILRYTIDVSGMEWYEMGGTRRARTKETDDHPRYKMIISYDTHPESQAEYQQFVMEEFVPQLQEMGVYMLEVWHTAYGDYPVRMISFVTEEYSTIRSLFESEEWQELEAQLLSFVSNYSIKVVRYRPGFQFAR